MTNAEKRKRVDISECVISVVSGMFLGASATAG